MASTTTLKYGPKISLSHVTMKGGGGGGPDPFIVKDYEKGPFLQPSLRCICHPPIAPQVRPTPSWEMPLGHPRPPAFHASPDLMKAAQPYKNLHSDDNPDFTQLKSRFQAISNPYFGHLSSNTMPL